MTVLITGANRGIGAALLSAYAARGETAIGTARKAVDGLWPLDVTRPGLPQYIATREALLERAGAVLGWVADGSLDVRVGARYPLENARRAHEGLPAAGGQLRADPVR